MPTNRTPLTEEQKQALVLRLKIAREAKEKKMAEAHVEKLKKNREKDKQEIKDAGIELEDDVPVPAAKPIVVPKEAKVKPVPEEAVPHIEQPKTEMVKPQPMPVHQPKKSPKVIKQAKEKYAKLVFYKEPTAKKLKKMQSILGASSDSEAEPEPRPILKDKPKAVEIDPETAKKLQYERLSKLAHHFFN